MSFTQLYKFGAARAVSVFAHTARDIEALETIGKEYGVLREQAQPTIVTCTFPLDVGYSLNTSTSFSAPWSGGLFFPTEIVSGNGAGTVITLRAKDSGSANNPPNASGDQLEITALLNGGGRFATVTAVSQAGVNAEDKEGYRTRLLDEIQTSGGGGNYADYREWAQEPIGVARAYPYAGREDPLETYPGDITVYVEARSDVDQDGIPTEDIIENSRSSIIYDPITGRTRQPLGVSEERLFVLPIVRSSFYVEIEGLQVDVSKEADAMVAIQSGLDLYLRSVTPWIDGLDPLINKNNVITDPVLSVTVIDVLRPFGGFIEGLRFGYSPGTWISSYILGMGERAKLADINGVTYV